MPPLRKKPTTPAKRLKTLTVLLVLAVFLPAVSAFIVFQSMAMLLDKHGPLGDPKPVDSNSARHHALHVLRVRNAGLRDEAVQLEKAGNWTAAIAKWRALSGPASNDRIETRVRELQARADEEKALREKLLALRNDATAREKKRDWAGAIEKWRASQALMPDWLVEERMATLQWRINQTEAKARTCQTLLGEALELEKEQDWPAAVVKWRAYLEHRTDPRIDARIAELQKRIEHQRAEAQRRAETLRDELAALKRAEQQRARELEQEVHALKQKAEEERKRTEAVEQERRRLAAARAAELERQRIATERERQLAAARAEAARIAAEKERQRIAAAKRPPTTTELAGTWNGSYTYGSSNYPLRLAIQPHTATTCRITITLQVLGRNQTLAPTIVNYKDAAFFANINGRTFNGRVKKTPSGLDVQGEWSWSAMGLRGTWRANK